MSSILEPLLSGLTAGARAAYPYIVGMVDRGLPANEIVSNLKELGLGARRADVLAIVRAETNAVLTRSDLKQYLKSQVIPLERVREAATKIIAPFSYRVELRYYDEVTGATTVLNRTAHSNELQPFEQVASDLADMVGGQYAAQGQTLIDAQVVDVVRSGQAGVI